MPDLTFEWVILFLVFVMPGVVTLTVYGVLVARPPQETAMTFLKGATYSGINLAMMSPVVNWIWQGGVEDAPWWSWWLAVLSVLVIAPCSLAWLAVKIRDLPWVRKRVLLQDPTAWDYYFRQRQPCLVRIHFKDGAMLGGYYGDRSFATSHPEDAQLFLENVWILGDEGQFVEPQDRSNGVIIRYSDCMLMEFCTTGGTT